MRWSRIRNSIRSTRGRRWALGYLKVLVIVAIFSSFLANDRPILASYAGEIRFPVFREIGEIFSGPRPYGDLPGRSWRKAETDWAVWPPVRYSAGELDFANNNYVSPFEEQKIETALERHWLGTDQLGRDTLAGLIRGCRIALLVGMVAMGIALLIGLLMGGLAGFFSNDGLRAHRHRAWSFAIGTVFGIIYLINNFLPYANGWSGWIKYPAAFIVFAGLLGLFQLLFGFPASFWPWWRKEISLPIDAIVLRIIELFNSFPTLILLIAVLPVIDSPTILTVMLVIGLIRWTGIARFVRAELLRIRQLPYIDAARISGFGQLRILFRHALPNALGPVVVALSFGVAGAILLEAYLSFLSIGLPEDQVSWGSLLQQSRAQPAAWWLAVFPGLAIFFTVLSLNVIGEAVR
ncbi:ABC transporter permease [Lewinellaceae bacterium SD302]|nr:ABC transporter permease [Lewinellaceae bacterium SD302]